MPTDSLGEVATQIITSRTGKWVRRTAVLAETVKILRETHAKSSSPDTAKEALLDTAERALKEQIEREYSPKTENT